MIEMFSTTDGDRKKPKEEKTQKIHVNYFSTGSLWPKGRRAGNNGALTEGTQGIVHFRGKESFKQGGESGSEEGGKGAHTYCWTQRGKRRRQKQEN